MAFEVEYNNPEQRESKVDWDALNKYTIETAGLQLPETLAGVVVGIVDLGKQEQSDAEVVFVGTPEDEVKWIESNPNTYFKVGIDQQTKKRARLKCWPVKPTQCVAVAVDFPDIMLDKGQFFDNPDAEHKPLRMWLGNQFYTQGAGQVVASPTTLKVTNLNKGGEKGKEIWSLPTTNLFYKMAVASKIIEPGQAFDPSRIDEVLGQSYQFQAQIYMRKAPDGKEYMTEKIKFVGSLGRGQAVPENSTEPFLVQFNRINSEEAIKQLRSHVVNTIKQSTTYEGSAIQKQLEKSKTPVKALETAPSASTLVPAPKPAAKPVKTPAKAPPTDPDDSDAPF
jgi:hypothetical protein